MNKIELLLAIGAIAAATAVALMGGLGLVFWLAGSSRVDRNVPHSDPLKEVEAEVSGKKASKT